jgi:SAM-dependent methyltransferase
VIAWVNRQIGRVANVLARLSIRGLPTGDHVTRFWYYRHLLRYQAERPADARAVVVSGSERLAEIFGYSGVQILSIDYPEFDLLNLNFPDNTFDALFADQVIEHVAGDPFRALAESFRVVKPGGFVVHATVFVYPVHNCPVDCWRFSPTGLRLLVEPHGEIIEAGGWGNFWVWPYFKLGLLDIPIPIARWHPLHRLATRNDPQWPIVTWVIARKPSA